MATAQAPGVYTLVYVVYNAISCLLSQGEQHQHVVSHHFTVSAIMSATASPT